MREAGESMQKVKNMLKHEFEPETAIKKESLKRDSSMPVENSLDSFTD